MAQGSKADEGVEALALLDSGSDRTFCSNSLIYRLGIDGVKTSVDLATIRREERCAARLVTLWVRPAKGKVAKGLLLRDVAALEKFPHGIDYSMVQRKDLSLCSHLRSLKEDCAEKGTANGVELLIGMDHPQALLPLEVRCGGDGEPFAVRTILGWTVQGTMSTPGPGSGMNCLSCLVNSAPKSGTDSVLEEQVMRFWNMDEPAGKETLEKDGTSPWDEYVVLLWDTQLERDGSHYVLPIPFKPEAACQMDNWGSARRRLESLGRRLRRDPDLAKAYGREIRTLLEKGYAERVMNADCRTRETRTWYLPHHPVLNPNKPGKVRIVFDCAASTQGVSLNTQTLQGPDLNNRMLGILLRFRQGRFALSADIEAMFYQVRVAERDRDVLRFLWKDERYSGAPVETFRMTVHVFGGVWSPACAAYALRRTFREHGKNYDAVVRETEKNFYVDDLMHSVDDRTQAERIAPQLSHLLKNGGFRLTKWSSNCPTILRGVPWEERGDGSTVSEVGSPQPSKGGALGLVWDRQRDTLAVREVVPSTEPTKRGILGTLSKIYDPLGIVAPFVVRAKMIFQKECAIHTGWDEIISEGSRRMWYDWLQELACLPRIEMPRLYRAGLDVQFSKLELHTFADASQSAYGVVIYARYLTVGGEAVVSFVYGKSRLAPLKETSIPRLELSAARLAATSAAVVIDELDIQFQEVVFWTDSLIVLRYLNGPSRRFKTYVANRVAAIQRLTTPGQWRHVPTESNPADDVSRGLPLHDQKAWDRWINGPGFLSGPRENWPAMPIVEHEETVGMELRPSMALHAMVGKEEASWCDRLCERLSCWVKVCRVVAWVRRFAARCIPRLAGNEPKRGTLDAEELDRAERSIIRIVQAKAYGQVVTACKLGHRLSKSCGVFFLEPTMDEHGVLRVGGRLRRAEIGRESLHPSLLPKDHPVAALIVRHVHRENAGHMGREHTIASLREKYWIPQVRPLVDRELRRCVTCRRLNWQKGRQREADLPRDRVAQGGPPFDATGLDCFGPFLTVLGRRREKRWGCLFTCLSTRAIHLEVLAKLDAADLLMAIVRFTTRRGVTPRLLRSDNGTNMVKADKELKAAADSWDSDAHFQGELARRRIQWKFNPPGAPHAGGVWERLIRTVKRLLGAMVGHHALDDFRLMTLFCEVERIVNNRPMTVASQSPGDPEVLTPAHALHARGDPGPLAPSWSPEECIRRRWRHAQALADQFWTRWLREYLPSLRRRQRQVWVSPNLDVGDVVLVTDLTTPRNRWPLARVVKVFSGDDGVVRRVRVRTAKGQLMRSPVHLCLLEGVAVREESSWHIGRVSAANADSTGGV